MALVPARIEQAYADYVALGDHRTLVKLWERYQECDDPRLVPTKRIATIKAWSKRYRWQERIRQAAVRETLAQERRLAVDRERERHAVRDREKSLAARLMDRAEEMLNWPLARQTREVIEQGADGIVRTYQVIEPTRWSMRDAAAMADVASKLMRLSVGGMETEHVRASGRIAITEVVAEIPEEVAAEYGMAEADDDSGVPLLPDGSDDDETGADDED